MQIKQPIIKILVVLFLTCLFSAATLAAPDQQRLRQALSKMADQYLLNYGRVEGLTAMAITVVRPAHAPISVYAGKAGRETTLPITADSLFQVGSLAKSFIVATLLKWEADPAYGFSIEDPITKFFPEYSNWHEVRIKQLMNMTSGIPDVFVSKALFTTFVKYPYRNYQPKAWVDTMYREPLLFSPGMQFNYSNTNYFLLGMLIEKLGHMPLSQVLNQEIIQPHGLHSTFYIADQPPASLRPYLVNGYQNEAGFADAIPLGSDVTDYSLSYLNAAGGMISTSADVAKWVQALFTPGRVLNKRQWHKMISVVSERTGRHAWALGPRDPYGYGLGIGVQYGANLGSTLFIYQGMTFGYRAIYVYLPREKIVIAITVNSSFDGKENHLVTLINQIGSLIL